MADFIYADYYEPACFEIDSPEMLSGFNSGTDFVLTNYTLPACFAIASPKISTGFFPDTSNNTSGASYVANGRVWVMIAGTWRPILSTDVNADGTWV